MWLTLGAWAKFGALSVMCIDKMCALKATLSPQKTLPHKNLVGLVHAWALECCLHAVFR